MKVRDRRSGARDETKASYSRPKPGIRWLHRDNALVVKWEQLNPRESQTTNVFSMKRMHLLDL